MASSLRSNPASLTPFLSPKPQNARLSAHLSFISIRCGRRDNRGPLLKGRILSSEAIQAIQSLKRAYRKSSSSSPADATLPSLSRLIKSDLLATLRELLRQEQCVLALHVFSTIRSEYPPPDLALYADMVVALARNRLMEQIDGLIDQMEEINCDDEKGLVRLMKGVIGAERKESTVRIFKLMKKSGVGSDKKVGEYVVKVLSLGLRNFGEENMAEEVEKEFCVPIRGNLQKSII
ncbi:hypothetical protein SLE2022_310380 [Rubroshorea leprosula]